MLIAAIAVAASVFAVSPLDAAARPGARTAVHHVSGAVGAKRTFQLKRAATHVAIYWRGAHDAVTMRS